MIFPVSAYRAPGSILRRNRKGQSGLWGYAISGDLPIVLLRVSDADNLHLVRDLLRAHAYWRMRGLSTDLVIWNEDASGYRRVLNDQILGLIAAGTEAQLVDKPGGVFVRHIDSFPEEDRVLLQAVARIVIRDVDGPLDQQLDRWQRATLPPRASLLAPARQMRAAGRRGRDARRPRDDLIFANGTGGFTRDGREYIVDLPPGRHTPAALGERHRQPAARHRGQRERQRLHLVRQCPALPADAVEQRRRQRSERRGHLRSRRIERAVLQPDALAARRRHGLRLPARLRVQHLRARARTGWRRS